MAEFGQALKKENPGDIPVEVIFESDDPAFLGVLDRDTKACGTLRGASGDYALVGLGKNKGDESCTFVGPRPTGPLVFQPRGYPSVEVAFSD